MTIVATASAPFVHYRDQTARPRLVGADKASAR